MLKKYQKESLEVLDSFCQKTLSTTPVQAFKDVTSNQYLEVDDYTNPYVCLRVPTGGGKTLIATKSLRILVNEYLNIDYHLIFWLAPSDKIVTQTLEALKDKRHFYRQQLDKDFDNINIMSVQESYKQKFDPKNELVIIIGTIQSFRTNNKDGRKFYDENGMVLSLNFKAGKICAGDKCLSSGFKGYRAFNIKIVNVNGTITFSVNDKKIYSSKKRFSKLKSIEHTFFAYTSDGISDTLADFTLSEIK